MAYPTQSVQVRRIHYHNIDEPIGTVAYQLGTEYNNLTASVQDPVMGKDPYTSITGYSWDYVKSEWYFSAT